MKIVVILNQRLKELGRYFFLQSIILNLEFRQNTPAFSVSVEAALNMEENVKQLQNVRRSCNMFIKMAIIFIFVFYLILVDTIVSI